MIDLVEEGFDLAVRNMLIPDSSLIVRRVATYRFVVCGAPGYFAARGMPKQPADLVQHNCLIYSHSAWGHEWRFAGPDGEQSITVSGNLQANSDNALRLAAVHGQGLALAPTFLVADEIKSGRLVPVLGRFLQTDHAIMPFIPIAGTFRPRFAALSICWRNTFVTIPPGPTRAHHAGPPNTSWMASRSSVAFP
jgi:DNA-binding transcriptional LysR family regulator